MIDRNGPHPVDAVEGVSEMRPDGVIHGLLCTTCGRKAGYSIRTGEEVEGDGPLPQWLHHVDPVFDVPGPDWYTETP